MFLIGLPRRKWVRPARGPHLSAPAARVVVPRGWKVMANVLDDAMSPQTVLVRCLTNRVAPDVGPKDRDIDERLWHQCSCAANLAARTRRVLTIRADTNGDVWDGEIGALTGD
jgi:hypothetical protein